MARYQHILCAVDLTDENQLIASRAVELASQYAARLALLHVVQDIPVYLGNEFVLPYQEDISEHLATRARQALEQLKTKCQSAAAGVEITATVVTGSTRLVVLDQIKAGKVDLIVMGRHGRHGLSRLLGSTANVIVHSAACDVLTIHIGE